ncbi:MAG: chemotaxis protein CheC [Lachnospiraceae bacterium]|nr:chemotaxis protein CheC [Lachnospiraceae bacterium]
MAETMSLNDVNSMYFDVLKEIGNIGAGNATTALAQMLGTKVDMSVPKVSLLEFKDVGEIVGGEELIMVGILLGVEGDITGSIMFMIEKEGARHLTNKLMMGMGASAPGEDFNEMELSALREVGNIITGAYLNALSGLTNLCIYPSTPDLTVDMAGAILSVPAIQFGIQGDQILLIQNNFFDEVELDGYFILLPDVESYGTILKALGISSL